MYSILRWMTLFFTLSAASNLRSTLGGVQSVHGRWLQIFSDRYVQTTSEIDYSCVTVDVQPLFNISSPMVSISKRAYQHGNTREPVKWSSNYTLSWTLEGTSFLEDNLVLNPVKASSVIVSLWLRRTTDNYILWTGGDNKTMYVWARHLPSAAEKAVIFQQLGELDFNTTYKTPTSSYSESCLSLV